MYFGEQRNLSLLLPLGRYQLSCNLRVCSQWHKLPVTSVSRSLVQRRQSALVMSKVPLWKDLASLGTQVVLHSLVSSPAVHFS